MQFLHANKGERLPAGVDTMMAYSFFQQEMHGTAKESNRVRLGDTSKHSILKRRLAELAPRYTVVGIWRTSLAQVVSK